MYSGSQENIVRVWDTKSGECISAMEGHGDTIQHVLLSIPESERKKKRTEISTDLTSPNDFHLGCGELYTASKDKTIKVWDLTVCRNCSNIERGIQFYAQQTGECKCTLVGHTAAVHSLQIFEKTLVSASLDHIIRVWDLKVCSLFYLFIFLSFYLFIFLSFYIFYIFLIFLFLIYFI
jgi:WD40 repeat protein